MWRYRPEQCPVCGCILESRIGALAHYKRHVRRKEAFGKGTPLHKFRCVGTDDKPKNWWFNGQPVPKDQAAEQWFGEYEENER